MYHRARRMTMHGVRRAAENGERRGSALGLCVLIEGATAPVRAREAPTVTVMHTTLCAKYIICAARVNCGGGKAA